MDPRLITAVIVVVGVPAVLVGYIMATEQVLRIFPERRSHASDRGSGSRRRWRSCSCT